MPGSNASITSSTRHVLRNMSITETDKNENILGKKDVTMNEEQEYQELLDKLESASASGSVVPDQPKLSQRSVESGQTTSRSRESTVSKGVAKRRWDRKPKIAPKDLKYLILVGKDFSPVKLGNASALVVLEEEGPSVIVQKEVECGVPVDNSKTKVCRKKVTDYARGLCTKHANKFDRMVKVRRENVENLVTVVDHACNEAEDAADKIV